MIAFFGILAPRLGAAQSGDEAPFKRSFFSRPTDAVVVTRAETDALYLAGKRPEPDPLHAAELAGIEGQLLKGIFK